jgi:hypothetical protein
VHCQRPQTQCRPPKPFESILIDADRPLSLLPNQVRGGAPFAPRRCGQDHGVEGCLIRYRIDGSRTALRFKYDSLRPVDAVRI